MRTAAQIWSASPGSVRPAGRENSENIGLIDCCVDGERRSGASSRPVIRNPREPCARGGSLRLKPGSDLLWHARRAHYHRRRAFSLPSSEWDRVVPARYCRQANCLRLMRPVSPPAAIASNPSPRTPSTCRPQAVRGAKVSASVRGTRKPPDLMVMQPCLDACRARDVPFTAVR